MKKFLVLLTLLYSITVRGQTAICKNVTLNLNSSGYAYLTPSQVNDNSFTSCFGGFQSSMLNQTLFSCTNYGPNVVVLTVTDYCSNAATCSAIVTVQYNKPPVAKCRSANVILSGAGVGSITTTGINNNSTDVCSGLTYSLNKLVFNCADLGVQPVTLTVTNIAGLSSICNTTVNVKDQAKPVAKCKTASVNISGDTTLSYAVTNNGSTDNCGIVQYTLTPNTFNCSNVGPNSVILTVKDSSGNQSSCSGVIYITCL